MSSEIKEINAEETEIKTEVVEETTEQPAEEKHVIVGTGDYETLISDEELAKKKRRKEIWDKITTGLLILVLSSPILIVVFLLVWFLNR